MSGARPPEEDDLIAGEYVLGLLEPAEARALEAEAGRRSDLAAHIAAWEGRLAPLLAGVARTPPASLWRRVEASAFGAPAASSAWNSVRVWRAATLGFALAAGIACVALLREPPPPRPVAALLPPGQHAVVILAEALGDGRVVLHPVGRLAVPAGRELELWTLPAGAAKPASLGAMPPAGVVLAAGSLPRGPSQTMVSLEPAGGSPTGLPTGPVLWAASLDRS